jgi:hypothetical protein
VMLLRSCELKNGDVHCQSTGLGLGFKQQHF